LTLLALLFSGSMGRPGQGVHRAPQRQEEHASEAAKTSAARFALPGEETLTYKAEWRLMRAGTATLNWGPAPGNNGRGWLTDLKIESSGFVSRLYKVENHYTSLLDAELCAISSFLKSHEGRRQRETNITFDSAERKASYLERDLVAHRVVRQEEIDIPACVHDVIGGLFRLRTMRLEPGQSAEIPVSDGKKSVSARVEAQAREIVETPTGNHKTIRYEAFLFNNVLYRRSGHLYVWLTEDDRRVPVQIRARLRFHIGTITLQLEKEERS